MELPVVVQYRHVHLCAADAQRLFGTDKLTSSRLIDQAEQSIYPHTVEVHGPAGFLEHLCVIGPVRTQTQVELSAQDARVIGLTPHLRISGDLERSSTVVLKTSLGSVRARSSTIVPISHVHVPPAIARVLKVAHHDLVSLTSKTQPSLSFHQVVVRVHPSFTPAFHVSADDAAVQWIQTGDMVLL